jgi:DNA topoisomerase-2
MTDLLKYEQQTEKQHILSTPDTYLGSIEKINAIMWILNATGDKLIQKNIEYIAALLKLLDEAIVNARDHWVRQQQAILNGVPNALPVTYIHVVIQDDGTIEITNDGSGIDVAEHPEYKKWIPELIFANMRTSTNYNKDEEKIVGGKNGFGFKLVLIWSTYGSVETVDHVRGLKYKQEFTNNLDVIGKPSITKCSSKPYTKMTFKPDYKRFGITLTPDIISLFKKRVYDIAAVTDKAVKVKYNSELVPVKNFKGYIDMYIGDDVRAYEENGARWEYAVALSPNSEFVQVSFVNGIHTANGGKHVEYILNQITRKLVEYIEKKKKITVNPNSIKEQLILFVRCDIVNPAFNSQSKEYMNTPSTKFGSKCEVTDKFIEKIAKMGVMEAACAITEVKEQKVAKKTDGAKTKNIRGIPKLTDANWAGTSDSDKCTLILCEGDSAKAGILSGLIPDDRNTIGVYPLKGKCMNVNGETAARISQNKEITELKKVLGLETNKEYKNKEDVNKLRYGKVLFMTDQDLDGSHIKGLCINLFHSEWHTLIEIPGFIGFMNTPILKAKKGQQELNFYNDGEYEEWKKTADTKGYSIKYYKGLGTSTGKEFREYFQKKKIVGFEYSGKLSDDAIDMVFNKKRADDRKDWLENYDRTDYVDTNQLTVSYEDFINKEFIHFSKYDCDRSIPNLMDGLKTSLRKILFSAFKKGLTTEIKVAQFSGYVSEHSCYHHGEASLNGAIVGMAQNFVGSNNINLLMPSGQFGTRLKGGEDSASERYIFTLLSKITRTIFPEVDDNILKYLSDDGTPVEPIYYMPIIPMILVNGSKGIGTGFSTDIMCYNPTDIIRYLKHKLSGETCDHMTFVPYYEGFQGTIDRITDSKFIIKGKYTTVGPDKIHVTELPIGYWTDDFKEHLESLIEPGQDKEGKKLVASVKEYQDMSKDTTVDFTITLAKGKLAELELINADHGCNGVHKLFRLSTTNTTTNMHLFDANDKLKKYTSVVDIINDYFVVRLDAYKVRKEYMINAIQQELVLLSNKVKYIREILNDTVDLRKKTKEQITEMLKSKGYTLINDEYRYLTKLPMDSVTEENVAALMKEHNSKVVELETVQKTTIEQMWLAELDTLTKQYEEYKEERNRLIMGETKTKKKVVVKKTKLIIDD